MNRKETDWTTLSIWSISIAGALLVFSFFAPMIFTRPSSNWNFTETGQIGDTLGGIMNPFIALAGVMMTFLAFYMQIRANKLQRDQFIKSQNNINVDEKIDCFYMLQLTKNDIDKVLLDVDRRVTTLNEFKQIQEENPYQLNKVLRSPLSQYERLTDMDRLSIYKGFKFFLSSAPNWLNQFNNLYNTLDYIPEAFKQIYSVIDYHNKDIFDDKLIIRNDLIELEKLCVKFINANGGENTPMTELPRQMLNEYRGELTRSNEAHEETNFKEIIKTLRQFTDNVVLYFKKHGLNSDLAILADNASLVMIKINFIQQKADHLNRELELFISTMTEGDNSTRRKLNEVGQLIGDNINDSLLERLQGEYNSLPEN